MLQHLAKGTAAQAQKLATRSDSSSDLGIGTSLKDGGEKIARNQAWTRYHMSYLIFVIFSHEQKFWRIKFTLKNANFSR